MFVYRPHRGSLADAMSEAKEFNDEQEMKEYIVKQWDNYFTVDDIIIDNKEIEDYRNGWKDTRYICTKRLGNENYIEKYGYPQCIGMCATDYPKV
jgi:hypothetical protein